jgi:hypothetical protein
MIAPKWVRVCAGGAGRNGACGAAGVKDPGVAGRTNGGMGSWRFMRAANRQGFSRGADSRDPWRASSLTVPS